jgi:NHL repeat
MTMHSPSIILSIALVLLALLFAPQRSNAQYTASTVAGGGPNNLPILSASIGYPGGIAFDSAGNSYIADSYSSHVFKVSTAGTLTIVAGNGTRGYSGDGGPAASAALSGPEAVFVDASGNIFIADTENSVIREVLASNGNIQTVVGNAAMGAGYSGDGGPATSAQLADPFGIFVDGSGNIFIADADNFVIREVFASSGKIQTVAGNFAAGAGYSGDGSQATSAQLDLPEGVFVDASGNIYIADTYNNLIRVVNPGTAATTVAGVAIPAGAINTVAGAYYQSEGGTECSYTGDGAAATSAQLCAPTGVFVDGSGDIFIADTNNSVVREVISGAISTIAGNGTAGFAGDGGAATSAELNYPSDLLVDSSGDIFIADTDNFVIREVSAGNIQATAGNNTLAYSGDGGSALNAELNYPGSVYVDGSGNILIADSISSLIREVVATTGNIQTVAGNGVVCASSAATCGDGAAATSAQLNNPYGLFLDTSGNVYIADTEDNRIRVANTGTAAITIAGVSIPAGDIATVAGDGTSGYLGDGAAATSAELSSPIGIFVDAAGDIFIADTDNHAIREVAASTGLISTVAGNGTQCPESSGTCGDGGAAAAAQLSLPGGVTVDSAGNIYISDQGSNRIRVVNTGTQAATIAGVSIQPGDIATVAGSGVAGYSGDGAAATSAQLAGPQGLFLDSSENIFIADASNFVIREVIASTGFIATVAGNNTQGFAGDGGQSLSAVFNTPTDIYGDSAGDLFVADTNNSRIRKLMLSVSSTPSAAQPAAQTASPGGTATYAIELTQNTGNPNYAITLSCLQSSLPSGASCSFSPAKITPGPLPVPFTLTVSVPASSASSIAPMKLRMQFAVALLPMLGILFAGVGLSNKKRRALEIGALCALLVLANACGGSGGGSSSSNSTAYNIRVQGTTAVQPNPVTITTAVLTVQ